MTTNKTGRITGTEMEEAISRFERDCRSDGVGETVRSFIREPLSYGWTRLRRHRTRAFPIRKANSMPNAVLTGI